MSSGKIVQIIGAVIDVEFAREELKIKILFWKYSNSLVMV